MKLLRNSYKTAEENLAFEEAYFSHFTDETLRIWRSPESVVVGKHQNALAESNFQYCNEHHIPIIRRISGGGTVYHDMGNINFSFYRFVDAMKQIDYDQNLKLITSVLEEIGFPVTLNDRHDILLHHFKISGNAQHVSKGRALHHGTILYDSDPIKLRKSIKRTQGAYQDKSVQSKRSRTKNLREVVDLGNTDDFEKILYSRLLAQVDGSVVPPSISSKLLEKYSSKEWNFHYGPKYKYTNELNGTKIELEVERGGSIVSVTCSDDSLLALLNSLIGMKHEYTEVRDRIRSSGLKTNTHDSLLQALF